MYKDTWTPKQGKRLDFLMEPDNRLDRFAVCVKTNEKIVGHIKKCTKTILSCLQRQSFSFCAMMPTLALGQKLLVKGVILAMERECKSLAN